MTPLAWVAALVIVGLVALALEVFVPSGGVLGFLSIVALIAGVALAFIEQGPWFGMAVLAGTCLAVPAVLGLAFRVFPETPLGRRVLPPPPRPEEVVPDADRRAVLRALVGRRGLTTSDLLPWGGVEIGGVCHGHGPRRPHRGGITLATSGRRAGTDRGAAGPRGGPRELRLRRPRPRFGPENIAAARET